jgi:ADP-ribose pyrophosphatase YjhB (NUDIX family)
MSAPRRSNFQRILPSGDDRVRRVCGDCGFIDYENPKVVVGTIVTFEDQILLCRRAIPPRVGRLVHPAGHLERGETTEAGAIRECWEEARAHIEIESLIGVHSAPEAGVVEIVYAARLLRREFAPGPESQAVALYPRDAIPYEDLAFPTTRWALERLVPQTAPRRRAASA